MKRVIVVVFLIVLLLLVSLNILYQIYRSAVDELISLFNMSMERVPYPSIVEHSMKFCIRLMQLAFLILAVLIALLVLIIGFLFIYSTVLQQ